MTNPPDPDRTDRDEGPARVERVIEVYADVWCPFTHVGLRRFVERRAALGRSDVVLQVRAWPLELVNGKPLDPGLVGEEIDQVRAQVAPELFAGFDRDTFPVTTLPALALAHAANELDLRLGERVGLALRTLLFEEGEDVSRPDVLRRVATEVGLDPVPDLGDDAPVRVEHAQGAARGVVGSPHFFTPHGDFFCPALEVGRDAEGHLRVTADPAGFESFLDSCFA